MSAVKRAMGVKGNFVFVSQVAKFMRENPTWTEDEVYRKGKKEWKVVTRCGAGLAHHVIRFTGTVKQKGPRSVVAGKVEITFSGDVVNLF